MSDPFKLERFISAQDGSFETAIAEISGGVKCSYWMWFIFPQIAGLGHSALANRYAIASLDEARAYLEHPLLGHRLYQSVAALQDLADTSAEDVFGPIDALKLRSSLTLFCEAGGGAPFEVAINRWFGEKDPRTLTLLQHGSKEAD